MNWTAIAISVVLLLLNGAFVAAEFALLASRRSRLEQLAAEGDRRADHALAGVRELSLMLAGAQLGITMASLGLGAVAEPALAHGLESLLGRAGLPEGLIHGVAIAIGLSIVVFLHMVVGEMAPKSLAMAGPESTALALARPFRAFTMIVRPFLALLNAMANGVVRMFGVEPQEELAAAHAPSDLLMLVRESAERGMLGREQHGLLERALDMTGLDAEAAMVPRPDIVAVPADASIDEVERITSATGRSRLPVYDGDLDHIVGVLHAKDLLRVSDAARPTMTAHALARQAFITVESRPIEDLMIDMRKARAHIAIVVDEYGSVSGLVALEDLIEELIGDFEDETDAGQRTAAARERLIRRRPDGSLLLSAALRPDELEDQCGIALPEGDYETIAGFVINALERVPEEGDRVELAEGSLEVTRMAGPRVVELQLHPQPGGS
jgi:CBS domain containing-hemolysin-like protein